MLCRARFNSSVSVHRIDLRERVKVNEDEVTMRHFCDVPDGELSE